MSDYSLSPWGRPKDTGNTAINYGFGGAYVNRGYDYAPSTATYTNYQPQQGTLMNTQPSPNFAYGKAQVATATYLPAANGSASMTASAGNTSLNASNNANAAAMRQSFLNQAPQVAVEYSTTTQNAQLNNQNMQNDNKYSGLPSIAARKSYASMMVENYSAQGRDGSTTTKVKIVEKTQSNNALTASSADICVSTAPQNQNTPQYNALKKIENRNFGMSQPQPLTASSTTPQQSQSSALSPRKDTDLSQSAPSASPASPRAAQPNPPKSSDQSEQKPQESRKWRRKHDGADGGNGDQPVLTADGSSLGPWKLQPQQALPKKAENALVKARLYLEQVKKKPSDELIQNRMDRIKLLNNGVPDWVPDQESPVCTFCGKIFTVLIRRHHCRKCGGLYCGDCTNWRIRLAGDPEKKLVRVCTECFCSCIINALGTYAGSAMTEDEDMRPRGGCKVTILCVTGGGASTTELGEGENLPEGKEERRRYLCIQEIINTEKSYVEDLEALVNVYMNPIKASGSLTNDQFSTIFSSLEVLLPMHKKIVEDLAKDEEFVGRAFITMCSFLKMYSSYCANQEKAIELLEKLKTNIGFMKVLNDCQSDPRAKGQNLSSFIIKPVQRICKYPLLFRELISHTPEDSPDYESIVETKNKIDEVVMYINERKRRIEQQRKMIEINDCVDGEWEEDLIVPARYWIAEYKVQGKVLGRPSKISDYMLFLFNNILLVTKIAGQHGKPYNLKGFIPLTECKIVVISNTEEEENSFEVTRVGIPGGAAAGGAAAAGAAAGGSAGGGKEQPGPLRFQFFCETEAERDLIVKEIKTTIKEMQKLIFSGKMIGSNTILASMTSNPSAAAAANQSHHNQQPPSSTTTTSV